MRCAVGGAAPACGASEGLGLGSTCVDGVDGEGGGPHAARAPAPSGYAGVARAGCASSDVARRGPRSRDDCPSVSADLALVRTASGESPTIPCSSSPRQRPEGRERRALRSASPRICPQPAGEAKTRVRRRAAWRSCSAAGGGGRVGQAAPSGCGRSTRPARYPSPGRAWRRSLHAEASCPPRLGRPTSLREHGRALGWARVCTS